MEWHKRPSVWTVFIRNCFLGVASHKQYFKAKEECVRVGLTNVSGHVRDCAQPATQEQKPVLGRQVDKMY